MAFRDTTVLSCCLQQCILLYSLCLWYLSANCSYMLKKWASLSIEKNHKQIPSRTYPLLSFCHLGNIPSSIFATPDKGGDMSGVEKLREGIFPGWKKDERDMYGVAKMIGADMSGRGFVYTPNTKFINLVLMLWTNMQHTADNKRQWQTYLLCFCHSSDSIKMKLKVNYCNVLW